MRPPDWLNKVPKVFRPLTEEAEKLEMDFGTGEITKQEYWKKRRNLQDLRKYFKFVGG